MPRRKCLRTIEGHPNALFYKPAGIPLRDLEEVILEPDEMEALRLSDLEGRYQEDAAGSMEISRQTFGRIIEGARKKIADALLTGKAIRISEASEHVRLRFRELQEQGTGPWPHRHRHGGGRGQGFHQGQGHQLRQRQGEKKDQNGSGREE